jgi:acylphosphatase
MAANLVRRHVVVTGRVQGVFFRDSVRERADAHG